MTTAKDSLRDALIAELNGKPFEVKAHAPHAPLEKTTKRQYRRRIHARTSDGTPIINAAPTFTKAQIGEMALAALSLPYHDPLGLEPEFAGVTNAEVMMIKMARKAATGDIAATEMLLDRVLGKPKQTSEVQSLHLTYEDFLKDLVRKSDVQPAHEPP